MGRVVTKSRARGEQNNTVVKGNGGGIRLAEAALLGGGDCGG